MVRLKGNMLIAQSGGPSMVINQSLVGAVLAAKATASIHGIIGARHGIEGIIEEQFVNLRRETAAHLEAVAMTPSSALGSVRQKPTADDCKRIFGVLKKYEVRYFFYIGGNDSAETAHIIDEEAGAAAFDLRCYHIPKTIDNDLRENDHTPGFGSAARFVACALMGDDLDNRSLKGVKIDVIMGRDAGFLTAAAALARTAPDSGPHLIYLPERPFSLDRFCADIAVATKKWGRCVVAVSEGIRDESGTVIASKFIKERDSHGNAQLGGSGALGDYLAAAVKVKTGIRRVRADTFGYLQRAFPGMASEVDAREARAVGEVAVKQAAMEGSKSGSIVIRRAAGKRYKVQYGCVPLKKVARDTRHMPAAYINRAGNDVTPAFLDYVRPIVGCLPKIALLKNVPLPGSRLKKRQ